MNRISILSLLLFAMVALSACAGGTVTDTLQVAPEVLDFFIFTLAVPVVVQIARVVAAKKGKPAADWVLQVFAMLLAVAYAYFRGSLVGLMFPIFPPYGADFGLFVGEVLGWFVAMTTFIFAAWGPVEIAYRLVLKSAFESPKIGGKIGLLLLKKPA